ncbi:PucR family transcriptional regulator [Facklamia lactis]|uniref:PucR family transcriptional regulator n=1 Tax=Facklamia lactis TaxID=2749967 RepID=UPI0018CF3EAC|nr:PucR family transcriptional regulator [Facklamia lactis]MBG9981120.1 PucR family transcriptional regulator [Facklamia lactis]
MVFVVLLEQLLNTDYITDMVLLTQPDTLQNQMVSNIEITETPDVEFYISAETFILTTGMVFKDNQLKLIDFIDSLIRAKGSGLAIKSGRFLGGNIDPLVIEHANKQHFPIINIPDKYPLGRLLHQMSNYIWDQQKEEIEFALEIQKQFSDLLLNNTSVGKVINEFSKIIKCPIILLSPLKKVIAYSQFFVRQKDWLESIESQFQQKFYQSEVPDDYVKMYDQKHQTFMLSVSNVFVFKYFPHYLLILNPENMTYPISTFTIDQAKLVLSYILYKSEMVYNTYLHASSSFMLESMSNDSHDRSVLYNAIEDIHLIDSNYYLAIEVNVPSALDPMRKTVELYEKYALIVDWLKNYGEKYFEDMFLFQKDAHSDIYIVLQNHNINIEECLLKCRHDLAELVDIDLIYSVGEAVISLDQLPKSLDQAQLAFKSRFSDYNREPITYYNNSGVQHLFHNISTKEIEYFCESVLKELAFPETDNQKELRTTLKVYLDNQCETTITANQLFVHRNTVKYRIEKCQEILGTDVHDPKASLNIRVALSLSI